MATCSSCLKTKSECLQETCPDRLSDSDSDASDDSEDDMDVYDPIPPSTLPGFESDLQCFKKTFPSLIRALRRVEGEDFDMGWLAGCVHDVILCLTLHLTDNHDKFPQSQSHLLTSALKERYCRPSDEWEIPPPKKAVSWIKPEELLSFFDMIHEEVEVKHLSRPAVPLTDEQVEVKVMAKEEIFGTMLDNAIKEMQGLGGVDEEDQPHEELLLVRWGWMCAREGKWTYPYWVYGPADVHGPVQLEPDPTPTEYKSTGEPVPMNAFSLPYQGPYPAQGTCLICMNEFADNHRELVVSRCSTGHLFHGHCLNFWVNDSAMDNANMCPHDRERLCNARPRIHPGELSDESDADESDEDDDIDMTDVSDQEDSDVDAEGTDDEECDRNFLQEEEDIVNRAEEIDYAIFLRDQATGQEAA
ncbi:uncharacterized protein N0V89_004666 [Didymosphaeria variabile]|uniref:RING-type domain-containing protein n=1 Tax=Didymosphaeria variabile TaxID=1932322 RepID=A0A9W8XSX1_9PLEO|nr:uncharacterized protein N0V89_004666 [Didymosphaeria variabile]KAJ4356630.1 hypothetical protein N0V89_004666 [Didymosphaeria variabile]